jgi:hypothetical protein
MDKKKQPKIVQVFSGFGTSTGILYDNGRAFLSHWVKQDSGNPFWERGVARDGLSESGRRIVERRNQIINLCRVHSITRAESRTSRTPCRRKQQRRPRHRRSQKRKPEGASLRKDRNDLCGTGFAGGHDRRTGSAGCHGSAASRRLRFSIADPMMPLTRKKGHACGGQKLRRRKSLVWYSTFSRAGRCGSIRAISTAPIIVEKIAKKAHSLSAGRSPGMNGNIRLL